MIKRVMILGAGSTGRGHVGELAHEHGWDLVLVDKDRDLVSALKRARRYVVHLFGPASKRSVTVDRYRACHVSETDALVQESLDIPLILTSLFSHNLHEVAPLVAEIITARHGAAVKLPLNVICCENMQHGSTVFKSMVIPLLAPEVAAYAASFVGFPDSMVSRVVPLAVNHPLEMVAEDFNEWTLDAGAFVGPPVDLPAIELALNQEARLARKFFIQNGGHAVCAYWGFHRGHRYIHEAVADPIVSGHVTNALEELARIVSRHYGFNLDETREYGRQLGRRGAVAELRDLILRVVRDPLRKLSRTDRFVAPAELACRYGLPCNELACAIAAVLHYYHPDDAQAVIMREQLQSKGAETAIPGILGLPDDHPLVVQVLAEYYAWDRSSVNPPF